MTDPAFHITVSDPAPLEGPGSPHGGGVRAGTFNEEILRLAEAARALSGNWGRYDEAAMRRAVQRVEVASCMGGTGLREGVALAALVRVFLNGGLHRAQLRKAIGLLAADILKETGCGN